MLEGVLLAFLMHHINEIKEVKRRKEVGEKMTSWEHYV